MNESFVIVHISDLHLDGRRTHESALKTLFSTISEKMQEYRKAADRVLLITGDLVDDPNTPALYEAEAMI
jgi:3',5'-cyclic AMP phosphodiesterase CpdA